MLTQDNYVKAMQAYFGLFGVTLATNPDYFWGAKSVFKFPYFAATIGSATTASGFFARFFGIALILIVLGSVRFGVSDRSFSKQATGFHVLTTKIIYNVANVVGTKKAPSPFVAQTWKVQLLVNIAFAAWGVKVAGGVQKLIKAD